jgi:GntP family gluconate:H+ symporter
VGLILLFLLYFKFHPFLALITASFFVALLSDRIPLQNATSTLAGGFADLMGKIGILLVLASIIGRCLVESGAADRIIRSFSRAFGEGKEQYSFLVSGFVLSMPVFFDTVFYLLAPLIRTAYARRKRDYAMMICAAAAGGVITHALVPPTPGPIVVAQTLGVSLGLTFIMGVLISTVPAIVGGIWYSSFINRRLDIEPGPVYGVSVEELEKTASKPDDELPSLALSLSPVLLPVLLISFSTVASVSGSDGKLWSLFRMLGDKDVAFLLGSAIAVGLVVRQTGVRLRAVFPILEPAVTSGTTIAFITCAGGAFGSVLTAAGVGELLAEAARDWGISLLLLAFVTALMLRVAQGSATVAMITTAGIIAPAIAATEMNYHPVYLVAVIGFGATACSWMNDSGFWIVCKMGGLTEAETLKTWTVLLTVVAFAGFFWVLLLSRLLPLV